MNRTSEKQIELLGEMFVALYPRDFVLVRAEYVANVTHPDNPPHWVASVCVGTGGVTLHSASDDGRGVDVAVAELTRKVCDCYGTQAVVVPRVLASLQTSLQTPEHA